MIFGNDYYHPLDREYGQVWTPDVREIIEPIEEPIEVPETKLTTKELGSSAAMLQPGAETLKARIWHGVSRVELGFVGAGKGSKEGLTPESFGREEREAMRDLARINDVNVSTHASLAIGGLAGFSPQEHIFSDNHRKFALEEIKRAIDFAADATTGGAVVVHTGEFPRNIAAYYGPEGVRKGKAEFVGYAEEAKKAVHYLVDEHTGQIITGVAEDQVAWVPKQARDENNNLIWLQEPDKATDKVDRARFEAVESYLKQLKEQADKDSTGRYAKLYARAKERFEKGIPVYETDPQGNIQTEMLTFSEFKKKPEFEGNTEKAAIAFFAKLQDGQMHQALGSARQYEGLYNRGMEKRDMLLKNHEMIQKAKEDSAVADSLKLQLAQQKYKDFARQTPEIQKQLVESIDLKEFESGIKAELSENEREIAYGRETSSAGRLQARQIQDRIVNTTGIEEFGVAKSAQTLAEAGMFAMEKTKQANAKLKAEGMQQIDPIYIAPENLFQDNFGSHPEELRKIITKSREEMVNVLVDKGHDPQEAKKLAEQHIAGTFDIGHANMWKKYFKGTDEEFNKWLIDEAKDLVKSGIVKHIHITDNLGYHDEHLAIGEGTAPIKEFLKEIEKAGLKDVIVEPGSTNFMTIWPDSLKAIGSPIYSAQPRFAHQRFDQVHQAYAGQTNPPYFLVGQTVPSEEWKLWSETPLE